VLNSILRVGSATFFVVNEIPCKPISMQTDPIRTVRAV
jgi:hypothetical protein